MGGKSRRWWPVAKALVSLAILVFLGRSFARDLSRPDLWEQPLHLGWLVPAAVVYLAGLTISALWWRRLLYHFEQRPSLAGTLRAYFLGQMGKYVPGKALGLVMRAALMHRTGVPARLAAMTAFQEVLTTMASGALLAAILFAAGGNVTATLPALETWSESWSALREGKLLQRGVETNVLVLAALALSALTLGPILPVFFNRMVARMSLPFRDRLSPPPRMHNAWLLEGLLRTACLWPLFGVALACGLQAVPGAGLPWDMPTLAWLTAVMGLAYVAGFAVLIAPGALGVREAFLTLMLVPELAARHQLEPTDALGKVLLAVLLLRLAWTTAEVLVVAALFRAGAAPQAVPNGLAPGGESSLRSPVPLRRD
jgi:hypothetical protein